ncbi:MAG: HPr family phosphocarrier protein [Myxococcota bacterium]
MSEPQPILFRVDPRLVHATLINAWVPAKGIQQLIVADDGIVADDRRRHIVEIAAIDVQRVFFCREDDVARALAENELGAAAVLFSTLAAVEQAVAGGLKVPHLNVGHYPFAPGRQEYLPSVFLGDEELSAIHRLQAQGMQIELRALPNDAPVLIESASSEEPSAAQTHAEDEFEVVNERGLHLRAAHVLAALCNRLPNDVEVGREGFMVNAKSLLGLTALGAAAGTRLKVVVTGPDAASALDQLRSLFARGFDEGVAPGRAGST